jgi:hypothetical protein
MIGVPQHSHLTQPAEPEPESATAAADEASADEGLVMSGEAGDAAEADAAQPEGDEAVPGDASSEAKER